MRNLEDFAGIASDWFWETDADHRFTYFSARMEQVTNMRPEDIIGRKRNEQVLLRSDSADFKAHFDDLHNHRPFRNFEYKLKRQTSEGYLWLRVSGDPVFDDEGTFMGYRGTGHDVTAEKEALANLAASNAALIARNRELDKLRRELELAAFEDPLTSLRNRRAFDQDLSDVLAASRANIALLHIDLDKFKAVNDSLGHPAGDMVLVTVAARITEQCGAGSEVYRIGGDEFALIAQDWQDVGGAAQLGQRIVDVISEPIQFMDHKINVGASVGVALSGPIPISPHRLIARSDAALYAAKNDGRNCVRQSAA